MKNVFDRFINRFNKLRNELMNLNKSQQKLPKLNQKKKKEEEEEEEKKEEKEEKKEKKKKKKWVWEK